MVVYLGEGVSLSRADVGDMDFGEMEEGEERRRRSGAVRLTSSREVLSEAPGECLGRFHSIVSSKLQQNLRGAGIVISLFKAGCWTL